MKKAVTILTALLPVIYAAMIAVLFLIDPGDGLLFAVLGVYTVLGLALPALFCVFTAKAERKFLAAGNVWLYAGNAALFVAETAFWLVRMEENRIAAQNGAMEGGLGLVLLIVIYLPHWLSYLFTRIAGAVSCERTLRGLCGGGVRGLNVILQLFPVADLVSSIWVWRKVKKATNL